MTLTDAAKRNWPTPPASLDDAGATSRSGDRKEELLFGGEVRAFPRDPTTCEHGVWLSKLITEMPQRYLNPRFVERLMGFPPGWLDASGVPSSEVSEMLSHHQSHS